jgi:hypothetical protein
MIPSVEKQEKYNLFIADYGCALFTCTLQQGNAILY